MFNTNSFRSKIFKIWFVFALIFCLTPWGSPPLALALGLVTAFTVGHPYKKHNAKSIKYLLQLSVVGLGFGMNFTEVVHSGKHGILFTVGSISITLAAGYIIGKLLTVSKKTSFLVSVGTAICGGSAIAAMAPVIDANEEEVAVSLGTVFILNSVALFIFPWLGHFLAMNAHQFGLWSAIAIHDTSSVVGAAVQYGAESLKIATTVKLTRALWIVPLALLVTILLKKNRSKISFPYFILAFVGASCIVSFFPSLTQVYSGITAVARKGLTVTLFLIGAGLSKETIGRVGFKPVIQGILLWFLISCLSLAVINSI